MEATPELIEKLKKVEIFIDFAEDNAENYRILSLVCDCLTTKSFKTGEIIIQEGDPGDTLYILYKGDVQVLRDTPGKDRFAVVNLSAKMNVFFGEIALIDNDKRSASVVAMTDCDTLVLTGEKFLNLCRAEPLLGFRTIYRIALRLTVSLRRSNADVMTLYQALIDEVST